MDNQLVLLALFFTTASSNLSGLFPGYTSALPANPVAEVPIIGGLADAVPAMRSIPGLSFIPKPEGLQANEARALNNAIEQFSSPLIRLTSGDSLLLAEDFDQMLNAVPKLLIKPTVDFSKLPPAIFSRACHGEILPGIPREIIDEGLKEHTSRIFGAALKVSLSDQASDSLENQRILDEVPGDIVADVINGINLPFLNDQQMNVVRNYYANKPSPTTVQGPKELTLADLDITPELFKVFKLLPENYDVKKIPKEVIQSVSRGELPDFKLLPADLQQYFMTNARRIFAEFSQGNLKFEEIMKKLPNFDRVEVTTFNPYDQKYVDKYGRIRDDDDSKIDNSQGYFRNYVLVAIGLVTIASIIIFTTFCILLRRKKNSIVDGSSFLKGPSLSPYAESTPRAGRPKFPKTGLPSYPRVYY